MFKNKTIRFGFALLFLTAFAVAVWLLSGVIAGQGGKITDGAQKIANIGDGKTGYNPRQLFWRNPDELLVVYNDAPKANPVRIRLSDGKRTPLFTGANLIITSVRGYRTNIALSPDGRYLLWIARIHKKGGNGAPYILDLDTLVQNPAKPVVVMGKISGAYQNIRWMRDSRHWLDQMAVVTLHDRTNPACNIVPAHLPRGASYADEVRFIGDRPDGSLLFYEGKQQKISFYDPFHPTAPVAQYRVPRQNLSPFALSPDGTRILWGEKRDYKLLSLMFDPKFRFLLRNRQVFEFLIRQMYDKPSRFYISRFDGTDLHYVFETVPKENIMEMQWTPDSQGVTFMRGNDVFVRPVP